MMSWMIGMPSILRSRLAMFAMIGAFLIPIGMSSLRGLTHVLTCQDQQETPFSLEIPSAKGAAPLVTTSSRLVKGEEEGGCPGLDLNMGAKVLDSGDIAMVLPITNESRYLWRGSVKLVVGGTSFPVDIGEIEPGATASDTIRLDLKPGTHFVDGALLIGP